MGQRPYITLSEAISTLAFAQPIDVSGLAQAVNGGCFSANRAAADQAIASATQSLCDAGFAEEVNFWGIHSADDTIAPTPSTARSSPLTKSDFLDYRRYVCGHDTLWKGERPASEEEYESAFVAYSKPKHIREVKLDRVQFESYCKGARTIQHNSCSDAERRDWIANYSGQNGDNAFGDFQRWVKYDGTNQAAFRAAWREIKCVTGRGRRKS